MSSGSITSWQIDGETMDTGRNFTLVVSKITADSGCSHEIKRHLLLGRKAMTNPDSILKRRDITLHTKVYLAEAIVFSHVWIWELDNKKAEHQRIDIFELWCWIESPLDCKEIKPVNPKGHQSWIFIGRTDVEAETPILWPPDVKNWFIGKDPDARNDWRQQEKGTAEDDTVRWPHQLDGHEFEQAPGVGDVDGRQPCCSPWGRKESDMTQWLNWTELNQPLKRNQSIYNLLVIN